MCVYLYMHNKYTHRTHTHLLHKQKLLFWMQLTVINCFSIYNNHGN